MPTLRDTYRQSLNALLADADRLGSTPDDIAARAVVLAELRHAITDMARADGYECDDHPDAAPAPTTDAPTLPHGLRAEDGWIAWGGGECPCRHWLKVEYVCRDGYRGTRRPAGLTWTHLDNTAHDDIIAYRRPQ